jgi:hypothetical protein
MIVGTEKVLLGTERVLLGTAQRIAGTHLPNRKTPLASSTDPSARRVPAANRAKIGRCVGAHAPLSYGHRVPIPDLVRAIPDLHRPVPDLSRSIPDRPGQTRAGDPIGSKLRVGCVTAAAARQLVARPFLRVVQGSVRRIRRRPRGMICSAGTVPRISLEDAWACATKGKELPWVLPLQ